MRIVTKSDLTVLIAETEAERAALASFATDTEHVFRVRRTGEGAYAFVDLGPVDDACRMPVNIVWSNEGLEERWRPISNLAPTEFELDGRTYMSVEGFWQGLKFARDEDRARVAALAGPEAKQAGYQVSPIDEVRYEGIRIPVGRPEHWALMRRACEAKFSQNRIARDALLSTHERWLTHKTRSDSRSIPGPILADIWMRIRQRLRGSD